MVAPDSSTSSTGTGRILAGRYRLGQRRGSGVDAAVFDAFDQQLQRLVALKVVHPDLSGNEVFQRKFRTAMDAASALHHPNIATVLDWGAEEWNGREVRFVVSEHLAGGSLREILDRGRKLSPSQALLVGLDTCKALDVVHRAGLVHDDIRPSTIVFGDDRRLRIVDVGLASLLSEIMWQEQTLVGNERAMYTSPERAQHREVSGKSDIYALALSLLESVSGAVPFVGDSPVSTLSNRIGRLMPVSADLGPLAAVLERAGRPEPDDRYSAAEFGRALVQVAEKLPRPAPMPILAASLFAERPAAPTSGAPVDPTGPMQRPAAPVAPPVNPPVVVVPAVAPPVPVVEPEPVEPELVEDLIPEADAEPEPEPQAETVLIEPVDEPEPDLEPQLDLETELLPTAEPPPLPPPVPTMLVITPAEPDLEPESAPTVPVEAIVPGTPAAMATEPVPAIRPPDRPIDTMVNPVVPASLDQPPKRRRGKRIALIMAVLVVLGAAGSAVAYFALRTITHVVPELTNVPKGEALNQISGSHWKTSEVEEHSDEIAVGNVTRTDPVAGTTLAEDKPLIVYVSSGPTPRPLPDLVGTSLADATTLLAEQDLLIEQGDPIFDENVPEGVVISWQVPDAPSLVTGDTVMPNTTIRVVLSAGPAPRPAPDLTGRSLADATTDLSSVGLVIAQAPDEFSGTMPAGTVIRQDPAPGVEVPRGGTVTVVMSKGQDMVPIPEFTATDFPSVQAALEAAGLVVGDIVGNRGSGHLYQMTVDGKKVTSGQTFLRGTKVDMIFL